MCCIQKRKLRAKCVVRVHLTAEYVTAQHAMLFLQDTLTRGISIQISQQPHQFKFSAIKIHMEQPKYNFIVLMRRIRTCVEAARNPTVSLGSEYTILLQSTLGKKKNYGNVVLISVCVSNIRHIFCTLCLNTPYLIFF